jgi:hypothetical protein
MGESVEDKGFGGDVSEVAPFSEEHVGIQLRAATKEGGDGLQAVLSGRGVVVEIRNQLRTKTSSEAGLDPLLEELNTATLGDERLPVDSHNVVREEVAGVVLLVGIRVLHGCLHDCGA